MLVLLLKTLQYELVFSESVCKGYEILALDVPCSPTPVRLVAVYRTPACLQLYTEQFINAISDLIITEHPAIIVGDFNFPEINWISSRPTASGCENFLEFVNNYDLKQFIKTPTRGEHFLDLLLSNDKNLIGQIQIMTPIGTRDHSSFSFDANVELPSSYVAYRRLFSKCDYSRVGIFKRCYAG